MNPRMIEFLARSQARERQPRTREHLPEPRPARTPSLRTTIGFTLVETGLRMLSRTPTAHPH